MTNYNKPLISIDVFDTAIFRRYYKPEDLLKAIENKYFATFYKKRIEAEKQAREENPYYDIFDIYKKMSGYNGSEVMYEIEEELNMCYANPEILNMYNCTLQVDFVFISDMYLPKTVIERMLEVCGYKDPKVFVSCECKAHKADGSLFKYVEEEVGRKISCHYGDNYVADILGARKADITPVFNPALHQIKINLPHIEDSLLKKYLAEAENNPKKDRIQKLACWYAPIMLEFTKWILNKRQDAQQGIFFVSRDMFIPYLIAKNILKAENIHYVHASRRSLAPIALKCEDKDLLNRIRLIYSKDEINEHLKADTAEIERYFKKQGIKNNDIFVDIGYAGTIQYSIEKLLNIKLQGFYLQTQSDLIKKMDTTQFFKREPIVFCLLVEFPFCSPENNVVGYANGKPIFSQDSELRRKYSAQLTKEILQEVKYLNKYIPTSFKVSDLEQLLIQIQYYADDELLEVYNRKIFSNREEKESIIGYDRSEIAQGKLFSCFDRSYSKPLFKKMLAKDKEYCHLSKLLEE